MIVIGGAVIGAVLGAMVAKRHGGRGLDMAQYAVGFAIALALLGLFATIFLERLL